MPESPEHCETVFIYQDTCWHVPQAKTSVVSSSKVITLLLPCAAGNGTRPLVLSMRRCDW
eukprot:6471662-Amphidinium_carterae.1